MKTAYPAQPSAVPGRPWWAPLPLPELPLISARRAYTEVLGVFSAFFLTGIIAAALLLGDHYNDGFAGASWAVYLTETVAILTEIGLALTVVMLLCERRGVTAAVLGLRWPRLEDGRFALSRTIRIVAWAFLAQVAGGVVNALLQTGHLPTQKATAPELIFSVADSLQAGIIEELVVLGFVVVTLRQAGRPLWEVCTVALVLRGSYHIYYGPGVAGILLWAAIFLWIYLRTGSLLPLMLAHAIWDSVAFLSQRWPGIAALAILGLVVLWIAAPILWLIERNGRQDRMVQFRGARFPAGQYPAGQYPAGQYPGAQYPGAQFPGAQFPGAQFPAGQYPGGQYPAGRDTGEGPSGAQHPPPAGADARTAWATTVQPSAQPSDLPPPGWHPDPAGPNRWRWWDGHRWTEHVSRHDQSGPAGSTRAV